MRARVPERQMIREKDSREEEKSEGGPWGG